MSSIYRPGAQWLKFIVRIGLALVLMQGLLLMIVPSLDQWLSYALEDQILALIGLCAVGSALYLITLWLLGLRVSDFRDQI
jgi:putative peptidoglycan lipid II flippase